MRSIMMSVCALLLAGCSSGGGDNGGNDPGPNPDTGPVKPDDNTPLPIYAHRLARVVYDFENNDTPDAVDEMTYDSAGRLERTSYIYDGDGFGDVAILRDDDALEETITLSYDTQNRVTGMLVERLTERSPLSIPELDELERYITAIAYHPDGRLERMDFEVEDRLSVYFLFGYTGEVLTQIDNFFTASGNLFNSQSLSYDGDLPQDVSLSAPGSGTVSTTAFTWRDDVQLDLLETTGVNGTGSMDAVYDDTGRMVSQIWSAVGVGSGYGELPDRNYTIAFEYDDQGRKTAARYDLDSNGSVDIEVTYEWEAGTCLPHFLWAPNGLPNFVRSTAHPFIPGTGVFSPEVCAP